MKMGERTSKKDRYLIIKMQKMKQSKQLHVHLSKHTLKGLLGIKQTKKTNMVRKRKHTEIFQQVQSSNNSEDGILEIQSILI